MENQSHTVPVIGHICLQRAIIFLLNQPCLHHENPHNQRKSCIRDTEREERGLFAQDTQKACPGEVRPEAKRVPGRHGVEGKQERGAALETTEVPCSEDSKRCDLRATIDTVLRLKVTHIPNKEKTILFKSIK